MARDPHDSLCRLTLHTPADLHLPHLAPPTSSLSPIVLHSNYLTLLHLLHHTALAHLTPPTLLGLYLPHLKLPTSPQLSYFDLNPSTSHTPHIDLPPSILPLRSTPHTFLLPHFNPPPSPHSISPASTSAACCSCLAGQTQSALGRIWIIHSSAWLATGAYSCPCLSISAPTRKGSFCALVRLSTSTEVI